MSNTQTAYLPHPVFETPIFTVSDLAKHVVRVGTEQNAATLTDLIQDSYDVHAEKPKRGVIANLVKDFLIGEAYKQAYKIDTPNSQIVECVDVLCFNSNVLKRESLKTEIDRGNLMQGIRLLENEIETLKHLLDQAA